MPVCLETGEFVPCSDQFGVGCVHSLACEPFLEELGLLASVATSFATDPGPPASS